jgi:hypothetical protein
MSHNTKPETPANSVRSNIDRLRELARDITRLNEKIHAPTENGNGNGTRDKQSKQ